MKINVKKLDATIEKLQQLRRLATDPALSDFIEITGVRNNANGSENADGNGNGHSTVLKANVLAACKTLASPFTIKDVYASMGRLGTQDSGTEKSVANVLRLLATEGELQIAVQGQGRRPTSYRNN